MIRKLIMFILTLALVLSLAACGGTPPTTESPPPVDDITSPPSDTPIESEKPIVSDEPKESEKPIESEKPTESAPPVQSEKPVESEKPSPEPTPSEEPSESESPEVGVTVQDIWSSISAQIQFPALMDSTATDVSALYGIDASILDDFCLKIPAMTVSATEIFIAKVSAENLETVKGGIALRKQTLLDQWSTYLPDQYDLVENAKVVTSGNYILFVISADADSIVSIFNSAVA